MIPSLLYITPPKTPPLSTALFEDLQLTQLMPSCPFDAALCPCEGENLPARQAVFAMLENSAHLAHMEGLLETVKTLRFLFEAHSHASCPPEAHIIAVAWMQALLTFTDAAARMPQDAPLTARFARFFKERLESPAYEALKHDLADLLPKLEEIKHYTLSTHAKKVALSREEKETYLAALTRANERLGLPPFVLREVRPRTLSPELIASLLVLSPSPFAAAAAFYEKHSAHIASELLVYEGELSFYLEMARMLDTVRARGIPLTYPTAARERVIRITEAYDISLIAKNAPLIVPNDIEFTPDAPFFYLTGANGGGKTTYLRTVGIALTLLLLGAPIPARAGYTMVPSGIFTHFPHDERFDGSGRFVEEHRRVEAILKNADKDAVILLNETYSTTNEENAVAMTVRLAEAIWERGNFGLYITHQHALGKTEIPYLNVLVDTDDNNRRTFKIVRRQGRGSSFAEDILKKYGLTPEALRARFPGAREEGENA